uniref:Calcium and integrin binding family member 3 n=1 Tax=Nannospalax galili TaxID=1026970 RepID=A0A8C6QGD9_NANGA
ILFYRYQDLAPQLVPLDYTSCPDVKVPYELIGTMPELKDNPFRQRIAQVFSQDGDGHMTLDNFLDMFSVMSEMAPRDLKAYYAFKIYDFNDDNYICAWDLEQTVTRLTRGELSAEEVSLVCEKVLDEADSDHDGRLSLEDFQSMILRSPDFLRYEHGEGLTLRPWDGNSRGFTGDRGKRPQCFWPQSPQLSEALGDCFFVN